MGGALIETEARKIWNEAVKETAIRMLQDEALSMNKIAKYSGISIAEVEHLQQQIKYPVTV